MVKAPHAWVQNPRDPDRSLVQIGSTHHDCAKMFLFSFLRLKVDCEYVYVIARLINTTIVLKSERMEG